MRRRFTTLLCTAAATGVLAMSGAALGAGHDTLGTPGTPNCRGQSIAYLDEVFKTAFQVNGIGGITDVVGLTVQQIQDVVNAYCA
jgi:hypothetical protein